MPATYSINDHDDYARVDVSGDFTPDNEIVESKDLWNKIANDCKEHGRTHVLAISSLRGRLPTAVCLEIADNPEAFGWDHQFKLALVFTHKERFESHLFTETVLVNRSYDIKAFMSENEALEWLLSDGA